MKQKLFNLLSKYFKPELDAFVTRGAKLLHSQDIDREVTNRLCQVNWLVNPLHVFQVSPSGIPYLGLEPISKQSAKTLHTDAKLIKDMLLYEVLQTTLRQKAIDQALKNSTEWEHVLPGKIMLYNLDIIQSVVDACEKMRVDNLVDGKVASTVLH